MTDKHLVERLTKPDMGGGLCFIWWDVQVDGTEHYYFIEEQPAKAFELAQLKAGHSAWAYKQKYYTLDRVQGVKFEDE